LKVEQSFVIAEPRERLWEFFEQVDEVARCVPGVESVELVDADNSKVRVTQSVGPMTATFDLKMRITERQQNERMRFTAIGRAVKGAAGNVRSSNTVTLEPVEEGTRVNLEADLAMGGVLGSVGQKVIAKQADAVTRDFMASLERAVKGEPVGPEAVAAKAGAARATNGTAPTAAPPAAGGGAPGGVTLSNDFLLGAALGALLAAAAYLMFRGRR
jgi:carbon monoxide dehydrogenase subunit G